MATISRKRQQAIRADAPHIQVLYAGACARFGREAVEKSVQLVWTWRCMLGMHGSLPFDSLESRTMGEVLWVARTVCGYGNSTP